MKLGDDAATAWRMTKFQLLVALDRADELDRDLRAWIRVDDSTSPWRQMLARLLAERGKLIEAIQLFEASEKDNLLTASEYRMLADWYLVSNRRDAYERSRIESFKQMPENSLMQQLYGAQNRWSRSNTPLPSELDENTLFALKALFEKSAQPGSYLHQLRELYRASRDFRLLQMLPDAMLGRSPQQVYAFLHQVKSSVLEELRNEASADEILVRLKKLREGDRTTTDLRALDLMEVLIERKSSELLNQPGTHIDKCLAGLRRAFQREWGDGEPKLMASFLFQLGSLPNEQLKTEQLRELRALRLAAPRSSRDRLAITMDLSQLMFMSYGQREESLRQMEVEVREYTQANSGLWPHPDNEILSRYVSLLESANRHAVGEELLQKFPAKPANEEQKKFLKIRQATLYNSALEADGAVSIGTGRTNLFAPLVAFTLKELANAPDENFTYQLISHLNNTFVIAHRHKLQGTREALQEFAFKTMPIILKRQEQYYHQTVTAPVSILREVLGAKPTLQYVVERMEQYPNRFSENYHSPWNAFGNDLSTLRTEVGSSELDERILKLTIDHLKHHLRTGEGSNHSIFYRINREFWLEKYANFVAAAEEVLKENFISGRRAVAIATYLRNGLVLKPRGIEILKIAHGNGLLDAAQQIVLVDLLREDNRFAEIIPIIEPLVKSHPDSMVYRTRLMAAYFHTQRAEQLQTLIVQTDGHFHQAGRWTEENASQFVNGCYDSQQWDRAKLYCTEAIVLHQRANPASGLNDAALSNLYQRLAHIESMLKNTKEAVAAAMSGMLCWNARHEQRASVLNTLQQILNEAKDRDAFVTQLDAEAARTGQDNPVLRKVLGNSYRNGSENAKAIVQFQLALELQPNDKETHQSLIQVFDAIGNRSAAGRQLLKLIDFQRHDLTLYQQLAERMKGSASEAERAATSIIESSPNEAESHAAMAELRQNQNRWSEAIPHWNQVARLRKLEPAGLIKQAGAQLHEKQFAEAGETIQKLRNTPWPTRFGDTESQLQQLQQLLPQ